MSTLRSSQTTLCVGRQKQLTLKIALAGWQAAIYSCDCSGADLQQFPNDLDLSAYIVRAAAATLVHVYNGG
jgi:hypothetical protein